MLNKFRIMRNLINKTFNTFSQVTTTNNSNLTRTVSKVVIGIDLGTTNSCVAIIESGMPKVLQNSQGTRTTPSVVAITKSEQILIGSTAKRQSLTNPENTIFASKRLIGRRFNQQSVQKSLKHIPYKIIQGDNGDAWIQVNKKKYSPSQIGGFILMKMKDIAESYLGKSVMKAVITVPAYFNDSQRQATKDAGRIAGLQVSRIINEPTAAALAYGLQKKEQSVIAVYDLGGGTFDISILQIKGGVFQVKATNGDTACGGQDLDTIIQQFFINQFKNQYQIDLSTDRTALHRLRQASQNAKIQLTHAMHAQINLPFLTMTSKGPVHFTFTLTRKKLQALAQDFLKRTIQPCELCIKDSGIKKNKIDQVILVGGMTRMPEVQDLVKNIFGKTPNKSVNPDQAVAVGAAIQGGILKGDVKDLLLIDVTPLSLGIGITGDIFSRIIPKNSPIPISKTKTYTTQTDMQSTVLTQIYQGEREIASKNKLLGSFVFQGIPPAKKGVPKFDVTFTIDANGLVNVTQKDNFTGKQKSKIVKTSGGLSSSQIQEMIKQADKQKQQDLKRKELIQAMNEAQSIYQRTASELQQYRNILSAELITQLQKQLESMQDIILSKSAKLEQYKTASEKLRASAMKIGEHVYKNQNKQ